VTPAFFAVSIHIVIPAKAGIHAIFQHRKRPKMVKIALNGVIAVCSWPHYRMDPGLRRDDVVVSGRKPSVRQILPVW
jgi:hypothetical protein